ncbi:MAG TPA: CAP domain-containing protein [Pirellulaceae bacterium]|nr:CAP domain-containing protein [Pirellulaceae bacterium]
MMSQPAIQAALVSAVFMLIGGFARAQSVEEFDVVSPEVEGEHPANRPTSQANVSKVADSIIEQTNTFRAEHGHRALRSDAKLQETAQYFADFMARTRKYGHEADDQKPSERADQHGYAYCIVLENIAYTYRSTGFGVEELTRKFVTGWKNSEGHRENMLDPDTYETGVAVSRNEKGEYYAVQMFGRPQGKTIKFAISNMSGETLEYAIQRGNGQAKFKLPARATRTHTQCRPSHLDLGWTTEKDELPTADGRKFVIRESPSEGLQVSVADSDE